MVDEGVTDSLKQLYVSAQDSTVSSEVMRGEEDVVMVRLFVILYIASSCKVFGCPRASDCKLRSIPHTKCVACFKFR